MRSLVSGFLCFIMVAFLTGCTTFQGSAGKTLASTAQVVDSAMQGWATWVVLGKATTEQENKVRAAYTKYQYTMGAARNAYILLGQTGDKLPWEQASLVLTQCKQELLDMVAQFQGGR